MAKPKPTKSPKPSSNKETQSKKWVIGMRVLFRGTPDPKKPYDFISIVEDGPRVFEAVIKNNLPGGAFGLEWPKEHPLGGAPLGVPFFPFHFLENDPRHAIMPPKPRGAVCEKMCARCPFRPDGSGYAQDHPDLPKFIKIVELGLPFYCHETALLDPRTKLDKQGNPDGVQPHFKLCRGGHEHRMKVWREQVLASGCRPGEE